MTPHTVLGERQRVVKRQIREENRIHQQAIKAEEAAASLMVQFPIHVSGIGTMASDQDMVCSILHAYMKVFSYKRQESEVTWF